MKKLGIYNILDNHIGSRNIELYLCESRSDLIITSLKENVVVNSGLYIFYTYGSLNILVPPIEYLLRIRILEDWVPFQCLGKKVNISKSKSTDSFSFVKC